MKKYITLSLIFVFFVISSYSQEVLLKEKVKDYSVPAIRGPGLKKYSYVYLGFGIILPVSDTTIKIKIPSSEYFLLGYRIKRKISHSFSAGLDMNIRFSKYSISQKSGKLFPDTNLHKRQTLSLDNLGLGLYARLIYGRHGNYLGKFIDLGIHGDWFFAASQTNVDEISDQKQVKRIHGMKFYEPFNSDVFIRFGFNHFAVDFSYRLSTMFKQSYFKKELPQLTAGIELGIF